MVLTVFSCSQDKVSIIPGIADVIDANRINKVQIDEIPSKSAGLYSDIYSGVRYIVLEGGNSSAIGNVDKIRLTKNDDLIVFDSEARLVLLFDSVGNFKNKIGNVGRAENEYIEPLDIAYDEFTNDIVVYDNAKKVLSYYDTKGTFQHNIRLDDYIGSFEILDENHIALFKNYNVASNKEEHPNYVIIDKKGKTVKEFAFFDKRMDGISMYSDVFYKKSNRLYCHIPTTPIVNEVTLKSLIPIYDINFGNYQAPNEWYINGAKTYNEKVILHSKTNTAISQLFFQTETHMLLTFRFTDENGFNQLYLMITDNEDTKQSVCYSQLLNDLYGKQSLIDLKYVDKNRMYFVLYPSEIQTLNQWNCGTDISNLMADMERKVLKQLPTGSPLKTYFENRVELEESETTKIIISEEEKSFVNNLTRHTNPIIQVCTLK